MKKELVIAVVASLLLGFGAGFALNSQSDHDHSHHDDEKMSESHSHSDGEMSHDHGMFMVDAANAPTVDFTVEEDAKSGWNVTLTTTNFAFAPQSVNGENVAGEGHAHLYVDGKKVARLYGSSYHYDGSFDGTKTFKVTLNANDHSEYAVGDEVIAAEKQVTHMHN